MTLIAKANDRVIFVSNSGLDTNSGTINSPIATLERAMLLVNTERSSGLKNSIYVFFRKGTYELGKTHVFGALDGGDNNHKVYYSSYKNERAIISGGKTLKVLWTKEKGQIWKGKILSKLPDNFLIKSLFENNKRLIRANSGDLYSSMGLNSFGSKFRNDYINVKKLRSDSINLFCGLITTVSQMAKIADDDFQDIIVYGSWEASWHKLYTIDRKSNTISYRSPTRYPVGFFNDKIRFRLENSKFYLKNPGEWSFDKINMSLYYFSEKNENPNSKKFVVPVLDTLLLLKGTSAEPLKNLVFTNLSFRYCKANWGISDFTVGLKKSNLKALSWLDFKEGFMDEQGAYTSGSSILLQNSQDCIFEHNEFTLFDGYALRIGEYSQHNIISNNIIHNGGTGGLVLGFKERDPISKHLDLSISPSNNAIKYNKVYDCGLINPSGIGILVLQANNNIVSYNEISHLKYSGISLGYNFDDKENFTFKNQILYNRIHKVVQELADGAGIYTLGKQRGTIIKGNHISDINRSTDAVGSHNNGFFFDESSSDFFVDSNVVFSIQDEDYRLNKTTSSNINWGNNYFEKINPIYPIRQWLSKKLGISLIH